MFTVIEDFKKVLTCQDQAGRKGEKEHRLGSLIGCRFLIAGYILMLLVLGYDDVVVIEC
jgi:hypothetical protein